MNRFEAHHRSSDLLDEPMILFEDVVQIFNLSDLDRLTGPFEFQDDVDRL